MMQSLHDTLRNFLQEDKLFQEEFLQKEKQKFRIPRKLIKSNLFTGSYFVTTWQKSKLPFGGNDEVTLAEERLFQLHVDLLGHTPNTTSPTSQATRVKRHRLSSSTSHLTRLSIKIMVKNTNSTNSPWHLTMHLQHCKCCRESLHKLSCRVVTEGKPKPMATVSHIRFQLIRNSSGPSQVLIPMVLV